MNEPTLVKRSDRFMDKQKKILIVSIFMVVVLFIGSSYALLSNFDTSGEVVNISTGNLSVSINNSSSLINNELNGKLPESDSDGLNNATPITITITNNGTLNIAQYDVKLVKDEDTSKVSTLDYNYIKYAISLDNGTTYQEPMNLQTVRNIIYTDYNLGIGQSKTITLKLWLDENGGNNVLGKTFYGSIDVKLYQKEAAASEKVMAAATLKNSVAGCTNGTYVEEDGITYFSGTNDCIDFNYVWYSGKLWRITSIDSTGNMKLITEDALTSINWGSDIEFNGSWVYQWLNEDFYDTLVDADDYIVKNVEWNYSNDGNSTPVKPSTIETQKTTTANVGLLSAYEYLKAYANASTSINYLNIGYAWWLITPHSSSDVRFVHYLGNLGVSGPMSNTFGVRPSIYLKSGISMTGLGSKSDPYRINDADLESAKPGDLLSSRMSGEYVNFDNDLYRIVSTENNITKLTRVDYLRDETSNDTPKPVINKSFASTAYFGKSTNTGGDTYWDYYLNNTWYADISSPYKGMVTDGIFYLGLYEGSGKHYKITICSDTASTLDSKVVKQGVKDSQENNISCTRYPTDSSDPAYDVNKIFVGKVGLLRVGEMFSAQLGSGYGSSATMWLVTPYSSSNVRDVYNLGFLYNISPTSYAYGVRPTINLASGVTITGGTGLEGSPYEITYTPSP